MINDEKKYAGLSKERGSVSNSSPENKIAYPDKNQTQPQNFDPQTTDFTTTVDRGGVRAPEGEAATKTAKQPDRFNQYPNPPTSR
jgi:hypothetical protein